MLYINSCLRNILNIKYQSLIPYTIVYQLADTFSNQMCWAKHLAKMVDITLPKQLFFGELQDSRRPRYKPKKVFENVVKNNIRAYNIEIGDLEEMTVNRPNGNELIFENCKAIEVRRIHHSNMKRALWKQGLTLVLDTL